MRFPRLTHFFHRRTRSDPEIHRLAFAPVATLETRPVSTDGIAGLAPSSSSDVFTSYVPDAPLPFTSPLPQHTHLHLDHHSSLPYRASDPIAHHHHSVLAILTQRIRDLETALHDECQVSACIPALQAALYEERTARDTAEQNHAALQDKFAALQHEALQLRQHLFTALSSQQGPHASTSATGTTALSSLSSRSVFTHTCDDAAEAQAQFDALAQENAALAAERARLRRFVDLMVSVGGHKPVIDAAAEQTVRGQDPEAALVAAIKDAAAQPESVWRGLLEPVTGVRTQSEYLAQLRATLDARRETQDWRKRTKFWKRAAREDGRHVETVTPSVSAISFVVEVLPKDRRERVEEMKGRLREGDLPLRVRTGETAVVHEDNAEPALVAGVPETQETHAAPVTASSSTRSEIAVMAGVADLPSLPPDSSLPAASSSMVLPTLGSISTARMSTTYSNLPPLASETFRASHSIKSISSRRSSRRGLPTSTSTSTQVSVKSRRRRVKIIALPSIDGVPSVASSPLPDVPPTDMPAAASAPDAAPAENPTPPTPHLDPSLPAFSPLPKALVDFGRGSDEDLVLVLHNDFSETSYRVTPERQRDSSGGSRASTPSSSSGGSTSTASTPDKKSSRLPVRMPGLGAIKRLSVSIALGRPPPPPMIRGTPVVEAAGGGSLSRTTKIPMGKRLQRFGFGGKSES